MRNSTRPTNRMRIVQYTFATLFIMVIGFDGVIKQTVAATLPHDPPPALGPPVAPPNAPVSILVDGLRQTLENEASSFIEEHNATSPHKLSWASGAKPTECGYDCIGSPLIIPSQNFDRPNERFVKIFGHLAFNVDIDNNPFSRRIITPIILRLACDGWQNGSGVVTLTPLVGQPFVADDKGPFEQVLDFLLMPLQLSNSIDAGVKAELSSVNADGSVTPYTCNSLGVDAHFDTGSFFDDRIVWEEPQSGGIGRPSLQWEYATVRIESIKRNPTVSFVDPSAGVSFEFFVNGQWLHFPSTGEVTIAPGETQIVDNVRVSLPLDELESLQVIARDSLGGAGWSQFVENDNFGDGEHALLTHRTELLSQNAIPGGNHLPPGDGPSSNKPLPFDIHEFEIQYSINTGPPVLVDDTTVASPQTPTLDFAMAPACSTQAKQEDRVQRPHGAPAGSCKVDDCGGKASIGYCYCDDFCESYNDCCANKVAVCDTPAASHGANARADSPR